MVTLRHDLPKYACTHRILKAVYSVEIISLNKSENNIFIRLVIFAVKSTTAKPR